MEQHLHREATIAALGALLMLLSEVVDLAATTIPSGFDQTLTRSMALGLTIFGVPFLFFGMLKRVDIPPHSRAGIPTERIFWNSAPESLFVTFVFYEGLHLASVFLEHNALSLGDLWSFIWTPIVPLAWIIIDIVLALLHRAWRK
jgi:hypothetical protein